MNILLVYPETPDTFWSFKYALKFINKRSTMPPLGLLTVAAMLPESWDRKLIDLNVKKIKEKDILWADYVFVSGMIIQKEAAQNIINKCKSLETKVVAGGPLFTGNYKEFKNVDHFILNEAEITLPMFLKDFESNNSKGVYSTSDFADIK